jgi:hypothetical protein
VNCQVGNTGLCSAFRHEASRFRTPRSRMLPSVIGGPGGCRCCAIAVPRRACGRTNIATKIGAGDF